MYVSGPGERERDVLALQHRLGVRDNRKDW